MVDSIACLVLLLRTLLVRSYFAIDSVILCYHVSSTARLQLPHHFLASLKMQNNWTDQRTPTRKNTYFTLHTYVHTSSGGSARSHRYASLRVWHSTWLQGSFNVTRAVPYSVHCHSWFLYGYTPFPTKVSQEQTMNLPLPPHLTVYAALSNSPPA